MKPHIGRLLIVGLFVAVLVTAVRACGQDVKPWWFSADENSLYATGYWSQTNGSSGPNDAELVGIICSKTESVSGFGTVLSHMGIAPPYVDKKWCVLIHDGGTVFVYESFYQVVTWDSANLVAVRVVYYTQDENPDYSYQKDAKHGRLAVATIHSDLVSGTACLTVSGGKDRFDYVLSDTRPVVAEDANDSRLLKARTVSIVFKGTKRISCGEGSDSTCVEDDSRYFYGMRGNDFKEGIDPVSEVFRSVGLLDPSGDEDLIASFDAGTYAIGPDGVTLNIVDPDTGEVLWSGYLPVLTDSASACIRLAKKFRSYMQGIGCKRIRPVRKLTLKPLSERIDQY